MFGKIVPQNTPEQNRFTSISDFKWCMKYGGEVQFIWNGTTYTIFTNNNIFVCGPSLCHSTPPSTFGYTYCNNVLRIKQVLKVSLKKLSQKRLQIQTSVT